MRTIDTADDIAEGLAHLARADRRLKEVAKVGRHLPLRRREARVRRASRASSSGSSFRSPAPTLSGIASPQPFRR